jgi:hypothetical protein
VPDAQGGRSRNQTALFSNGDDSDTLRLPQPSNANVLERRVIIGRIFKVAIAPAEVRKF